jgi:hypothetical protein
MPVTNTACPHCGHETLVNVPDSDTTVRRVDTSYDKGGFAGYDDKGDTKAACQNCENTIYVWYG